MRATMLLALSLIVALVSIAGIIAAIRMDNVTLDVFAFIETVCFGGIIASCLLMSAAGRAAQRPAE